jgi:hypothetical protein
MASRTSDSDPRQIGSRGKSDRGVGLDRRYAKARKRRRPSFRKMYR